jgi:hypothetical protein
MPSRRDPLSVRYDAVVHDLMLRAVWASRNRAGVRAWVASPRGEFRARDRGGRTAHERAFTRSAYYLIFKNGGEPGRSGWSLKLTWGDDGDRRASSHGRLARPVTVRLFNTAEAEPAAAPWVGTGRQSAAGRRIDA